MISNLVYKTSSLFKFLLILILLIYDCPFITSQTVTEPEKKYFSNGQLKTMVIYHGADTLEYLSYFKNGQLKDSLWFKLEDRQEIPILTGKSYFKNGKTASLNYYGTQSGENTTYDYYQSGKLRYYEKRPTGLTKFYTKKGQQIREYDFHKLTHVFVPARYKNGKHLQTSAFAKLIQTKEAILINDSKEISLTAGTLFSLKTNNDTNLIRHCLLEGFSKDSIYISKFNYSPTYDRLYDYDVLEYKRTYGIAINQLKTIYYTKHATAKRRFGAKACFNIGFAVLFIPALFLPSSAKAINEGNASVTSIAIGYGSSLIIGTTLLSISKKLYKTTVPVKYEMQDWRIIPIVN